MQNFYFDFIPVALAVLALYNLSFVRRNLIIVLLKLSAVLLIICQTTWIHSYLNNFSMITSLMDNLWTVFNSLVMIVALLIARESKPCRNTDVRGKAKAIKEEVENESGKS